MEEVNQKKENKRMIYLVIGLLTLILSTAGATYAYFTATDSVDDVITGNMATIEFDLAVTKMTTYDDEKSATNSPGTRGLIPMSNSMVEYAVNVGARTVNGTSANPAGKICQDDNGNAVCQIYKITVTNTGTAGMFLDGYVTLTGGTGTPTDLDILKQQQQYANLGTKNATTMRWSQVFCNETSGTISGCTTAGKTTTSVATGANKQGIDGSNWATIINTGTTTAATKNTNQILIDFIDNAQTSKPGITTKATIAGSEYDVINTNFIRISDHSGSSSNYTRTADVTSALMFNEFLSPSDGTANNPAGGSSASYTDSQVYYIVVWLSETGTNQTLTEAADRVGFFNGVVKFISAQGSEVTATFTDYTSVPSDNL